MKRLGSTLAILVTFVACGAPSADTRLPPPTVARAVPETRTSDAGASKDLVEIDPKPLVAKHRAAVGSDAGISAAARIRLRTKIVEAGLESTETSVISDQHRRSEMKTPSLATDVIEVWDGKKLTTRGWNGDVRTQGPGDRRRAITNIALYSLGYLRDPATAYQALSPQEEGGTIHDRLLVTPSGGEPVEMWLRPDGLAAKWVFSGGRKKSIRKIEAYAKQGEVMLPKVLSKQDSMTKEGGRETIEAVEFLTNPPDAKTFEPPPPKLDATFPKGVETISMPVGLLQGRYLAVTGSLGGRRGSFLLDTGASMTVMDDAFLAEAGIRFVGGTTFASDAMFKGVRFARVPELDVGGVKLASQIVLAIPLRKSSGFPLPVDGILGYDFWSRFVTSVDYPAGTLTLQKPGAFAPGVEDVVVPFELEGTLIEVPVTINGKNAGSFALDTGNGGQSTIHRFDGSDGLVPRGGNPLRFQRGIVYGSSAAAAYEISVDIGLGPFVHRRAPVEFLDPNDPKGEATHGNGNIGFEFLRAFKVTFDYRASTIYLRQKRPLRPASVVGVTGLSIRPTEAGFVVDDVAAGWPGDKAGIKVGDVVLAVDGVPTTTSGSNDLVPGETRKYTLRRGTATLEAELVAAQHP